MSNWVKRLVLLMLPLVMVATALGAEELEPTAKKVKEALLKTNYYAEYTETIFRFGRRSETMLRLWVKDSFVIKQVQSPLWQWGELTIQNGTEFYYYLPAQNSCLKLPKKVSVYKNRLNDWESWLKKVDKSEEIITAGRSGWILSGGKPNERFKLTVDHTTFLPQSLEVYKNNLLVKAITVLQCEELNKFKATKMIPAGEIKWYTEEELFWQEVSIPRVQNGVNFPIVQPSYLPSGYVFKNARLEELSSATVVHLIYEGPEKQVLSIFEREKLSANQKMNAPSVKDGGVEINMVQWFKEQVHLVIIGPLPNSEIRKMAESF